MRHMFVLPSVVLLSFVSIWAQSPTPKPMATPGPSKAAASVNGCDLQRALSPAVRGLRLGMTEREADKTLGGNLKFGVESDSWKRSAIVIPQISKIVGFDDVKIVHITAYEDQLIEISIEYDLKWKDVNEFVDNFSPKLGVPNAGWVPDTLGARMKCKGFDIVLTQPFFGSKLILEDTLIEKEISARKAKILEEKKNAIKP